MFRIIAVKNLVLESQRNKKNESSLLSIEI